MTDWELLQQWNQNRSDRAFRELVERHAGFVFSSALRQLRNDSLAAEVTQAAFVLLSQKAATFREDIILPGWLFRTTRFLAARVRRAEQRRKNNESNAAMSLYPEPHPEADALWRRLGPHVDDALAALSEKDRQAILLRFFQQKSIRQVASEIGLSEDAAKKRVSRAIVKLRDWLQRRGVTTTALALTLAFAGRYAEAAPLKLISKLTATATAATSLGSPLIAGALRDWFWTHCKIPVASIAILMLLLLIPIVREFRQSIPPHSQLASLDLAAKSQPVVSPAPPRSSAPNFSEPRIKLIVRDKLDSSLMTSAEVTATAFAYGENGIASVFITTESAKTVYVKVTAENRVPLTLVWNIHELQGRPIEHECFLSKATQLSGIVVDETGSPIEGAQLRNGIVIDSTLRENFAGSETRTEFDGSFLLDKLPELSPELSSYPIFVTHPDFQSTGIEISSLADLRQNHRVVLKNGIVVRGIVTDHNHLPIAGAGVSASARRDGLHGSVSVQSDSGGQFVLGAFPEGITRISVTAEGYRYLATNQKISAGMEPLQLALDELAEEERTENRLKRFHFLGTVAASNTGQPVQNFRALFCNGENGIPSLLIGEGTQGHFDWTVSNTFQRPFCLMIEAPGFRPTISPRQQLDDGEHQFAFKLDPALFISGAALTPNGNFAAGANVWIDHLNGPKLNSQSKPVSPWSRNGYTNANTRGEFTLELGLNSERLIVVHETGCIILPLRDATNVLIQLQPWSALEGVFSINGKPPSPKMFTSKGHRPRPQEPFLSSAAKRSPTPKAASASLASRPANIESAVPKF
jgi:RNA polymerase sigma factor (sigma-70 family)